MTKQQQQQQQRAIELRDLALALMKARGGSHIGQDFADLRVELADLI